MGLSMPTTPYACPYTVGEIDVPTELQPFIDGYLQRREDDITQLRTFIANKDYAGVGRIAHKLAGNGASYGFFVLSEIARDIQTELRNNHFDELPAFVDHLQEIVREIKRRVTKP